MAFVKLEKCHNCGKSITDKDDVRIRYDISDRYKGYALIHKECDGKIPNCCVCGDPGTTTFRGIAGALYPTCDCCLNTISYLDDCMGEGRKAVIKEAKRLILGKQS
jgi:hypothetical protein